MLNFPQTGELTIAKPVKEREGKLRGFLKKQRSVSSSSSSSTEPDEVKMEPIKVTPQEHPNFKMELPRLESVAKRQRATSSSSSSSSDEAPAKLEQAPVIVKPAVLQREESKKEKLGLLKKTLTSSSSSSMSSSSDTDDSSVTSTTASSDKEELRPIEVHKPQIPVKNVAPLERIDSGKWNIAVGRRIHRDSSSDSSSDSEAPQEVEVLKPVASVKKPAIERVVSDNHRPIVAKEIPSSSSSTSGLRQKTCQFH